MNTGCHDSNMTVAEPGCLRTGTELDHPISLGPQSWNDGVEMIRLRAEIRRLRGVNSMLRRQRDRWEKACLEAQELVELFRPGDEDDD